MNFSPLLLFNQQDNALTDIPLIEQVAAIGIRLPGYVPPDAPEEVEDPDNLFRMIEDIEEVSPIVAFLNQIRFGWYDEEDEDFPGVIQESWVDIELFNDQEEWLCDVALDDEGFEVIWSGGASFCRSASPEELETFIHLLGFEKEDLVRD